MSETVIKVENLYKEYKLGVISHGTLYRDLQSWCARIMGKDDPNSLISAVHKRGIEKESFLALKNVSFDIEKGERVGIIGRNGAGKSTLLKILSRITSPTKGEIKIKGRIGSLLEVGTGFHPELTGRENIYLNGAILGMNRHETRRKLDEIVDFAGIEKHLDTPVKRYSSGMNVRLGFAVAAHLEPEILIVDEVLAVGDAEFQRKALGKMKEVSSGEGRTILFVSHNMAAVQQLCEKGLLLHNGSVNSLGDIKKIIPKYLTMNTTENLKLSDIKDRKGNGLLKFQNGIIRSNGENEKQIEAFENLSIKLEYEINNTLSIYQYRIDVWICDYMGVRVGFLSTNIIRNDFNIHSRSIEYIIKNLSLAPGDYNCIIYAEINNAVADWISEVLPFSVVEKDYYKTGKIVPKNRCLSLFDCEIR